MKGNADIHWKLKLEDEQGLSMGEMLTVDFGTPSYEFTVNIFTYLIF
jgi:hypothetical protein